MSNKEQLEKLKWLVGNNRQWNNFSNYIDSLIEGQQRTIEQSDNPTEMYRAQGALSELRKIKNLRDVISNLG